MTMAREIYRRLYPVKPLFLTNDILKVLRQEPELAQINVGIERHEGYKKSVRAE